MARINVEMLLKRATSLAKKGDVDDAAQICNKILQQYPKNLKAKKLLGALINNGRSGQNPPQNVINNLMGMLNAQQFDDVEKFTFELMKQFPGSIIVLNLFGIASAQKGNFTNAVKAFTQITGMNPFYAEGFNNLGNSLLQNGNLKEATDAFIEALKLEPGNPQFMNSMGLARKEEGNSDDACKLFKDALRIKPDYAEALNNLGGLHEENDNFSEAIACFRKALNINPNYHDACFNLGILHERLYQIDEAIAAYEKCLKIWPTNAKVIKQITDIKKFDLQDPFSTALETYLKSDDFDDESKYRLHYAYAKICEDNHAYQQAFDHYVSAGALRKSLLKYDVQDDEDLFSKIKLKAPKVSEIEIKEMKQVTCTPIFILGMPRSGTTLIEQILSSHSNVSGGGELSFFEDAWLDKLKGDDIIDADAITAFRAEYLEKIKKLSSGKPYVTDKMPHNFLYINLIITSFPEAKIIHVHRDPGATCWSNFKHFFQTDGLGYSYDLGTVVRFFEMYQDLMRFWENAYDGRIFNLDYDRLTADQDAQTRSLIRHTGLEWEDACLFPEKNQRVVRTASNEQVRQPVYKGSSANWKKFDPFIDGSFDHL
jgi:tetratricopeptide (TPR) repeat protein